LENPSRSLHQSPHHLLGQKQHNLQHRLPWSLFQNGSWISEIQAHHAPCHFAALNLTHPYDSVFCQEPNTAVLITLMYFSAMRESYNLLLQSGSFFSTSLAACLLPAYAFLN